MLPAERPSGEVNAADIASDPDSVIEAYPPVDRSSTGEHETDDVLTEPRHTSKTPSEYWSSTETGTEEAVHVMITIAGGPTVDRTSTGVHETIVLTPASVAEEPCGDPATVESSTPRVGAATADSKVDRLSIGDKASGYDRP